ncbi:MAG TPA: hypothetical protein P5027_14750, partial [Flavobacteriales bacterium]|nr:hypothetical protein [Flavobacteriales bacterium]
MVQQEQKVGLQPIIGAVHQNASLLQLGQQLIHGLRDQRAHKRMPGMDQIGGCGIWAALDADVVLVKANTFVPRQHRLSVPRIPLSLVLGPLTHQRRHMGDLVPALFTLPEFTPSALQGLLKECMDEVGLQLA